MSGNSRILLVKDDSDLLQLFHEALDSAGFQVDGFSEPLKAYSQFQEHSDVYDLVISNIRMPGLSGIQLAKRLKEVKEDVKIFLMSAFDMTDDRSSELREMQLNEFQQKPFQMQKLVSMVEKSIGQRAITNSVQIAVRAH